MKIHAKKQLFNDNSWVESGLKNVWLPYTQMKNVATPLPVIDAYGSVIKLEDGRELIDGVSSWWTACHGYKNMHIVNAIKNQAEQLSHIMFAGLANEPAYALANRLTQITPSGLSRVFFSDSGSTAVEVAMKMARQYWANKGNKKKNKFICFRNGYHGDTMGAMSVSDSEDWIHGNLNQYSPKQYCLNIPRNENEYEAFSDNVKKLSDQFAALIIEPLVQCAGGFKMHSVETLKRIRDIAKEHEILFIADEVATGFGRTGELFACNEANITPDILCIGKALTGGYIGLAATIATEDVFAAFYSDDSEMAFMHGPTYMGNPLACAAANASLDLFESEPRLSQVKKIEAQLNTQLQKCKKIKCVKDVRIKGAIGAIQLEKTNCNVITSARAEFVKKGAWLRPFDNVFYIMPPFIITDDELTKLTDATFSVLNSL